MTEAVKQKKQTEGDSSSGLQLNKKSIIGICILLVAIMAFAGVLTQVMPRGEYYVYPENTYKLTDGTIVAIPDAEAKYEVDKEKSLGFGEYLALLDSAGVNIKPVKSVDDDTATDVSGMVIDGTYHKINYKMPIWKIALSLVLLFGDENVTTGLAIILFIVLIGGTFLILDERGVLKYIMAVIIKKFEKKKYFLLCMMVFVFRTTWRN